MALERADYGAAGRLGVLTPQANTTVEPELWALLPPGWSMLNARLVSDRGTIAERLVDYTTRFEATAGEFANAPLDGILAACTGASYLIGAEREAEICDRIETARGLPFVTAARASVAALRTLGARRIALLSPYPDDLNAACKPYWQGFGFEVVATEGPDLEAAEFHPIYAMRGAAVLESYRRLSDSGADAVLMLGTGMATLAPLAMGREAGLAPAISCNLALAWAGTQKRRWADLELSGLEPWLDGAHWRPRLAAHFPDLAPNRAGLR